MNNCNNMIISIRPIFANKIIAGDKTVELRKRIPNIQPRTRLWIYATRPDAAVIGAVILEKIEEKTPEQAWAKYSADALIERGAFDAYFANAQKAYCLLLTMFNMPESVPILSNSGNYGKDFIRRVLCPTLLTKRQGALAVYAELQARRSWPV